jgi:cell division control protein 45
MLIPHDQADAAWSEIKQCCKPSLSNININYSSSTQSISSSIAYIYCSTDADSVCSAKILTQLLDFESIIYQLQVIVDFSDLINRIRNELAQNNEIRCIILLNCGGIIDLQRDLGLFEGDKEAERITAFPDLKLFVIDSHRPYHLQNVSIDNKQIIVIAEENENEFPFDINKTKAQLEAELEPEAFEEEFDPNNDNMSEYSDEDEEMRDARRAEKRRKTERTFEELFQKSLDRKEQRRTKTLSYYKSKRLSNWNCLHLMTFALLYLTEICF